MSALEFAAGGELFDYLMYTGHFDSRATRTYFGQLISGLSAMHTAGIAHRDLKPENLLMDKTFTLKIADFGFATEFIDAGGREMLMKTPCGTKNYLAPEFWQGQKYTYKCDIFACGIILFTIYAGFPPFMEAQPKDWWWDKFMWAIKYRQKANTLSTTVEAQIMQANKFRAEADRRMKLFWKAHTKKREFEDDDFKELALNLIHPSARKRYDLRQISAHPWMKKGDIYSANELRHYLGKRVRTVLHQRSIKIRTMMHEVGAKPVAHDNQYGTRKLSNNPLSPLEKRALELDPHQDFLKNITHISDDMFTQSAFQFFTYVPPAEMAARIERAVSGLGTGGLCNVNPKANEITINLTLKYDKPQVNHTFEDAIDECTMTVKQFLVDDVYHNTEDDDSKNNNSNNNNSNNDSESEAATLKALAHNKRWLITFRRLRGQHSTYCSLVEKILFCDVFASALTWEEVEQMAKTDENTNPEYELHDIKEECTNAMLTIQESEHEPQLTRAATRELQESADYNNEDYDDYINNNSNSN
jgi:serine/threonine protein kinase